MLKQFPEAGIEVTIIDFKPAGLIRAKKHYSTAHIKLIGNANGAVTQDTPDGPIVVEKGVVDLVFRVASTDPGVSYYPVGISFLSESGGLGMDDFPTRCVAVDAFNNMMLTVHDANVNQTKFEFKLVIQRDDGDLGIIDPQINNA